MSYEPLPESKPVHPDARVGANDALSPAVAFVATLKRQLELPELEPVPLGDNLVVAIEDAPSDGLEVNKLDGYIGPLNDRSEKMATVYLIGIEQQYRHQGIGSRLIRAFTRLAVAEGATQVGVVTPRMTAVHALERVFGRCLNFYEQPTGQADEVAAAETALPAQVGWERLHAVERTERFTEGLQEKYGGAATSRMTDDERKQRNRMMAKLRDVSVVVDLKDVDAADWEPDVPVRVL